MLPNGHYGCVHDVCLYTANLSCLFACQPPVISFISMLGADVEVSLGLDMVRLNDSINVMCNKTYRYCPEGKLVIENGIHNKNVVIKKVLIKGYSF